MIYDLHYIFDFAIYDFAIYDLHHIFDFVIYDYVMTVIFIFS